MAVAGRSQPSDPTYFVHAFRVGASDEPFPLDGLLDPNAGPWRATRLAGKDVVVGTTAMIDQDEHIRGRPFVYDDAGVRFIIVTDDDAWAEEALRALP